ncbi:MAG: VWA domain-containing protein [Planctomycetaceae bacterium]
MTLLHPWLLALALLLLLRRRRPAPALLFGPGALALDLPRSLRARLLPAPRALHAAGLALLALALARPVERVPLPHLSQGIDILLCLDTSSSMTATDLDPRRTRLEVAKEAAARFIQGRPTDRIGILSFARFPDLLCPPTPDHAALLRLLQGVEQVAGDGPEDATGLGTAAARAAQVLAGGGAKARVVILFTDGAENVATPGKPGEIAPLHAAQLCMELGVRVYAIAALPVAGEGGGEGADTRPLRRLAERTSGRFYTARDAGAVGAVYAEIDALERVEFEEARFRIEERFQAFLIVGLALLLFGRLLGATALRVLP